MSPSMGQHFPQLFEIEALTKEDASAGDKVVVEMVIFPSADHPGEIVVTKVLGPHGDQGVDVEMIIHEFNLRTDFPEEVLEQARCTGT